MTKRNALVVLLASLAAPGCGVSHGTTDAEPLVPVVGPFDRIAPLSPVRPVQTLARCVEGGGELVEIASVDNNDQHDHGTLLTFGVSPTGMLAAAGADGTLKFWTLDAGLVGSVDGSVISYGAEVGASPITDVAFMGEMAIVGDVRGLVQQMGADGSFGVLGGTMPDVPIVAVAFHEATGRFAHAQTGDVVPLAIHDVDGSSEAVEIEGTLPLVTDLAFASNGDLWIAGAAEDVAALEIRDAEDPTVVRTRILLEGTAPIAEIALSADGRVGTLVASDFLYVVDAEGVHAFGTGGASSVAVTADGSVSFTIGDDGALRAHARADGRALASVDVARPVAVRVDASGSLVIVGGEDAILHAFACEE